MSSPSIDLDFIVHLKTEAGISFTIDLNFIIHLKTEGGICFKRESCIGTPISDAVMVALNKGIKTNINTGN